MKLLRTAGTAARAGTTTRATGIGLALLASLITWTSAQGVEWGPETNLSQTATDSESGLNHRAVAVRSDGSVHVVWAERDGPNSTYRVWTRRREGDGWGPAARIVDYLDTDPGNPGDDIGAKYPALVVAPNDDLHLFWHDYRIGGIDNVEVFWKMCPTGGAWDPARSADVRLTTSQHPEVTGENAYVPVAAVAPDGAVQVAWYDYRFDAWSGEVLSKTRPAGGSWDLTPGDSADERVTNDASHSELVDVAVDGVGNLHAVWRSLEGGARIRHAIRAASTGSWSAPTLVDLAGNVAGAPAVAVDGFGTLHVVWPDSRDGGRALFTRTRSAAGIWDASDQRITQPGHGADEPSLCPSSDGTLHLAFSDGRISLLNREIFHRQRDSGGMWDSTGALDTRVSNAGGNSSRPSVASRDGDVFIVWKDIRDGNHELYFRQRSTTGTGVAAGPVGGTGPRLVVSPNPARGGGVRLFRADRTPIGTLDIVSAAGRRVGQVSARGPEAVWDLRDDRGRRVGAGVYFVRATTGERARFTVMP